MEFTKTDVAGEPLPNTKIEIFTENDEKIFEGYTDENGKIVIKDLPVGKFYILESEAPEGYILNDEKQWFEIKEDGEIVKSTMINEKIIEVPNTSANSYFFVLPLSLLVAGTTVLLVSKKKKNKKVNID